ncbi:MAG: hypothetical protein LBU32_28310 [Clostridiales bacterium]|jgi:protein-tyrosine phosphatase|nr:hypothetical protein [Clostridiales bacterium]
MDEMIKILDAHTHILPEIDDGAKNSDISFEMLQSLSNQGVKAICLTPHYYHLEETQDEFLEKRAEAFSKISDFAEPLDLELFLGAEVYFTPDLLNERDISELCIGKSRYLLLEFPYSFGFASKDEFLLERFINNLNVIPILAHIERYSPLVKNEKTLTSYLDMGCLAQINISSIESGYFMKKRLLRHLEKGFIQFLGTDCHNLSSRPPECERGLKAITEKLGKEFMDSFWEAVNSRMKSFRG